MKNNGKQYQQQNQCKGELAKENKIIELCKKYNLILVKSILKPIRGLRSTTKDEYILFFQKG